MMGKGFKILILSFFIPGVSVFSQQLSHQVLVPLAGLVSDNNINYSQTVGETAVEIVGCFDFVFTQGFQQPGIKASDIVRPDGSGVKIYPNPVSDYVTIELFGDSPRAFKVDFITLSGTIVRTFRQNFSCQFWFREPQDIKDLKSGLYLIRIMSEDGLLNRVFKIEKI
jgi:hypothetical protein